MNISKQDRNGVRTVTDLERRYKFGKIKSNEKEIKNFKENRIIDSELLENSSNPVQNGVITKALSNKVDVEEGKGLSSKDFTEELELKLNEIEEGAEKNKMNSISLNGIDIENKNGNINIQTIKEISIENYTGYVWYNNGLLIQWGKVLLEELLQEVPFTLSYSKIPYIQAIPISNIPIEYSIERGSDANLSMIINSNQLNEFEWKAVGYKNLNNEMEEI